MTGFEFAELRFFALAYLHTFLAAGVEFATRRRICGRRYIALEYDAVHLVVGVGHGNC